MRTILMLTGMTLCASQIMARPAYGDDADLVLKKIQNYDQIYSALLTVRGEVVESESVKAPYLGPSHKKWILTLEGERHALVETLIDRDLKYRGPSEYKQYGDGLRGISFDEQGNLFRHFYSRKAVSFEPDRSATADISTVVQISPDGEILSEKDSQAVMRYGPGEYTLAFPIKKLRWTLGRGFGPYLDQASEVTGAEEGLLNLVAAGTCLSPEHSGTWKLTLDPESQYLVRSATFFPNSNAERSYLTITNTNPRTTGSVVYPAAGTCVLHHAAYDDTAEYTFSSVVFEADQSVVDEARSLTENLASARTLAMDHTVVPVKTNYVSENETSIDPRPPMEVKSPYRTLIVVNIILIIMLALFFAFRASRR